MVQLFVSIILYFVMFFGIGFIVNMLIRKTWLMTYLYPFILIIMFDNLATWEYFVRPGQAFSTLGFKLVNLTSYDIILFVFGFLGTIMAGYVMKLLRKNGYQMF
ncbi:YuiB family protein [Oceanobacillus sp. Castelsardo]|uniref:YuiB family protein n=1 Tax=Oceanobacillus sp. Castelsardo TaxID=1851204 RepID=UPI000A4D76E8|nr:YuiB family protein [Oceanobacillus sp. Castelsardo]